MEYPLPGTRRTGRTVQERVCARTIVQGILPYQRIRRESRSRKRGGEAQRRSAPARVPKRSSLWESCPASSPAAWFAAAYASTGRKVWRGSIVPRRQASTLLDGIQVCQNARDLIGLE